MAPKKSSSNATPSTPKSPPPHARTVSSSTTANTGTSSTNTIPTTQSSKPSSSTSHSRSHSHSQSLTNKSSPQDVALHVWNQYLQNTPSRTLLLDAFMAFLVVVGGVQFLYAVIGGNYPFNAFLSGFSAAVGQFVLTASLRMQTSERAPAGVVKKTTTTTTTKTVDGVSGEIVEEGKWSISSERAFADYVFGSLILHGFCVNFIN